jgi:hypothetical protein
MECPQCHNPLMVSNSKFTTEVGSIDVYSELTMVCINPKCANYCGTDLNHPLKVAATVRNKVN